MNLIGSQRRNSEMLWSYQIGPVPHLAFNAAGNASFLSNHPVTWTDSTPSCPQTTGFHSLPDCRIVETSQSRPPLAYRPTGTLKPAFHCPLGLSAPKCSPMWPMCYVVTSYPRHCVCIWLKNCFSFHLPSGGCHMAPHLVLVREKDSFLTK